MKPFLTAEWCNLIMANYECDKNILLKYLPAKTELDTYNNTHYISLVAFLFKNTKIKGVSIPFHKTFEEINLRFYVRYKENGQWKRGVVFIKEIVPKIMIVFVANTLYGEKYIRLNTSHNCNYTNTNIILEYQWKLKDNWNKLKAVGRLEKMNIQQNTEAAFITEHYWGYTKINSNTTKEYEVQHPIWQMHAIENYEIQCNFENLYGQDFALLNHIAPRFVIIATGSQVAVMQGKKI